MSGVYNPKDYWEERLKNRFNLQGVGHLGFTEGYNQWLYRRKRRCLESALRDFKIEGKDVLDIGCGTGFFLKWYLAKGAKTCGLDITEASVARLRLEYEGEFFAQDITASDFRLARKFDLANMWDVIYHVVDPHAFRRAFDNIAGSLKEGGLLLLTDWLGAPTDRRIADHVQARCLDTYLGFMPQKGFTLLNVYPLYHSLNKRNISRLDNYLGWLYYFLDNRATRVTSDNLSLGLWRYDSSSKR